jgi:hypothetical protein
LFFWMFDMTGATRVDTRKVRCLVLCLAGSDDHLVSLATPRATAPAFPQREFWGAAALRKACDQLNRGLDVALKVRAWTVTVVDDCPQIVARVA